MKKDIIRIKRLADRLGEVGVDYLLVFDEPNIHYLAGGVIDYSAVCLDVKSGDVIGIVNVMEADRASKVTWIDAVYVYSRKKIGGMSNVLVAENLYHAAVKVLDGGKVAISFRYVSHEEYRILSRYLDDIVDATGILMDSRMVKTDMEIKSLERSAYIVDEGISKVSSLLKDGYTENELMLKGKCYMMEAGADKTLDFLIVASGPNSAYPHWRCSDRVPGDGDPVTLDFVAAYKGYYGDETRTFFIGNVGSELRKIYEIVLEAQQAAVDAVSPGVRASDVHQVAWDVIERSGYGKYFTHSTGHGLGLEIHEPPRLYTGVDKVLEPGMVLTVEPGIYIDGLGGVRIEDMVLVTSGGGKVLTKLDKSLLVL